MCDVKGEVPPSSLPLEKGNCAAYELCVTPTRPRGEVFVCWVGSVVFDEKATPIIVIAREHKHHTHAATFLPLLL
jgi:hypothetical protein